MQLFLTSFILFYLIIFTTFFVGSFYKIICFPFILENKRENFLKQFSLSIIIGFILITSILAVFHTGFKTVYIYPFLLLLIPLTKFNTSSIKSIDLFVKIPSRLQLFYLFLVAFLVFSYNFIVYFRSDGYLFYDLIFTGKIAKGITEYGCESIKIVYAAFGESKHQILYHYSDLWITGFISKFTHFSSVNTLVYVMYPFLHFSLLLLIITYFNLKKVSIWFVLLAIGLLYGSKLFIDFNSDNVIVDQIQKYRGFPCQLFGSKLLPIYNLAILSAILYKSNFHKYAFITLSLIPVFYATTMPAIAGIGVGILFISLINKKYRIENWNISVSTPLILFASILFLIFFKYLVSFELYDPMPIQILSLKSYFILFLETIVKVFTEYFIIFLLLVYLIIKTRGKIIFKPLVLISLSGLLSAFVFRYIYSNTVPDLDQALNNISPILVLILGLELMVNIKWKFRKILILLMLLSGVSNLIYFYFHQNEFGVMKNSKTLSPDFTKNVHQYYLKIDKQKIIACSIRSSEYILPQKWTYDAKNIFQDLFIINEMEIPLEIGFLFKESKNLNTKDHPFFKMFKDRKISEDRIFKFLKLNQVNHLFIEDYKKIPESFLSHFTLMYKDSLTGGSFWKIKDFNKKVIYK